MTVETMVHFPLLLFHLDASWKRLEMIGESRGCDLLIQNFSGAAALA